jgi:hypothetical protein
LENNSIEIRIALKKGGCPVAIVETKGIVKASINELVLFLDSKNPVSNKIRIGSSIYKGKGRTCVKAGIKYTRVKIITSDKTILGIEKFED